jgi:glycosyltransferase involved in cell wall biosynthesis
MTKISVCIPTVRPATLGVAIASIRAQTLADWELLVVGQGDESALRRAMRAAAGDDSRVRYLHVDRLGLSAARNAGLAAAAGGTVAMIDDDCSAHPDWLATLAKYFDTEPELGMIGGSLLAPPPAQGGPSTCLGVTPGAVRYDPVATPPPAPPRFDCYGANFALRRSVAARVGPFDEYLGAGTLFPAAEDLDYTLRLEDSGVVMRSVPHAVITHVHGHRYGLRAVAQYWRRNAAGVGALMAKRALLGDPLARERRCYYLRAYTIGWLRPFRPDRLLSGAVRLQAFLCAYRRCQREFRVDRSRGVLLPAVSGRQEG